MTSKLPSSEKVEIAGPAGILEALVETPSAGGSAGTAGVRFAVLCHPHPLHGGTMTNKVVHTLGRAFNELGVTVVRFNFRGVGASAGKHDDGRGETDDASAVIAWGRERWPGASLWLGGFSFGGVIAARAAQTAAPELLVTVAPAVTRLYAGDLHLPACPWLVVQGAADDIVEPQSVVQWAQTLDPAPTVRVLAGAGHFFHGKLIELRDVVMEFCGSVRGWERPR